MTLLRDEAAVNEVLGFILMFALSSIILIFSLRAFTTAQDSSNDLVAAVELKNIANRISARLVQAGNVGQEFPQAEFKVVIRLPDEIAGYRYTIQFRDRDDVLGINDPAADPIVYTATDGSPVGTATQGTLLTGEASIFNVDEVKVNDERIFLESGTVRSSAGAVTIHYWYETTPGGGSDPAVLEGHLAIKEGAV